jgi:hypothetical protein
MPEGDNTAISKHKLTFACFPSITATQEFVVPRSIPITDPLIASDLENKVNQGKHKWSEMFLDAILIFISLHISLLGKLQERNFRKEYSRIVTSGHRPESILLKSIPASLWGKYWLATTS